MAFEDNEQLPAPIPEASAPKVAERSLWKLSRDEQRILMITFVGGLASIVVGACVIGGLIALARALKAARLPLDYLAIVTPMYIFGVDQLCPPPQPRAKVALFKHIAAFLCRALYVSASPDRFGCRHPLGRSPPDAR